MPWKQNLSQSLMFVISMTELEPSNTTLTTFHELVFLLAYQVRSSLLPELAKHFLVQGQGRLFPILRPTTTAIFFVASLSVFFPDLLNPLQRLRNLSQIM